MPSKLHLKRTPEEEAARARRKARKADKAARREAKSSRKRHASDYLFEASTSKRPRTTVETDSEDDNDYGPPPPDSKNVNYEQLRAQLEEERFREKMCGAFDDDERLDTLEARMNDYAHVPDRWKQDNDAQRGPHRVYAGEDDYDKIDPTVLDDEDYAEWIRRGMYRRTHATEYAENLEKETRRAARLAEEKAAKAEAVRLEALAEETRQRRKAEKNDQRRAKARQIYEERWKSLLDNDLPDNDSLSFVDVPWPVFSSRSSDQITLADITNEAISVFLLPPESAILDADERAASKRRQAILRGSMLRFHPDKFEGRIMSRMRAPDTDRVREAIGIVVRALSELMKTEAKH